MNLALVDEAGPQPIMAGIAQFTMPTVTVRDVIRARAELYWEAASRRAPDLGQATERGFGSMFRDETRRDAVAAAAEKAFLAGNFYLLFDDRQAERLDEKIDLARTGTATFLVVTPLKGG